MAKKPRSGKPQPGGRVTPKGVRPAGTTTRSETGGGRGPAAAPVVRKVNPSHDRAQTKHAPTRAGHHRGQR